MGLDKSNGKLIAVKQLRRDIQRSKNPKFEYQKQFVVSARAEVQLLSNFEHPNIIKTYGVVEQKGETNVLFEFAP